MRRIAASIAVIGRDRSAIPLQVHHPLMPIMSEDFNQAKNGNVSIDSRFFTSTIE